MKYKFRLLPTVFACLLSVGCDKDDTIVSGDHKRGDLIESVEKGTLTKDEIVERVTELPAGSFAQYGVRYEAVTYRTEYMGKPIDSRGLLILPQNTEKTRLIMYCHGTELPSVRLNVEKITPSLYDGGKDDFRDVRNMGLAWATAGYTVFIPDYIGFGLTLGKDHPYVYFPEMFVSDIDGLLAVKKILQQKKLDYDNRLFLTGWSQGAGAALSAHKYIQQNYAADFSVIATSGLSGPYNFSHFAETFLEKRNEEIAALPIFSWGLYSLNKFSALRRPTDQIYTYQVYDQFASILVPSKKPDQVFSDYFLNHWADGSDVALKQAMAENSFHQGWKPVGKVFLHHGDADELVPSYNTEDAYNGLTAAGGDVKKYIYPGGGHASELGNFISNTLTDFNLLK
jgi:pimeloyl-ACP methyl ester carboxylesterase